MHLRLIRKRVNPERSTRVHLLSPLCTITWEDHQMEGYRRHRRAGTRLPLGASGRTEHLGELRQVQPPWPE